MKKIKIEKTNGEAPTLGALIDAFGQCNDNAEVQFDFVGARPDGIDSWRGSYNLLAIGWSLEPCENGAYYPKVSEIKELLESAIGAVYSGYKGGDYHMNRSTPVWVDNYGKYTETGIKSLLASDSTVIINTGYLEY